MKDRINIIAHRGLWNKKKFQNTFFALTTALISGYGIEFDIRDYNNEIIVRHDVFKKNIKKLYLNKLLNYYKKNRLNNLLLINIKSDGILHMLKKKIAKYGIKNYFIFDMSNPELFVAKKLRIKFLHRISEFEIPLKKVKSDGYWIDFFKENKKTKDIKNYLKENTCFVSQEIHGKRNFKYLWVKLKNLKSKKIIMLMTDYPKKAEKYFS